MIVIDTSNWHWPQWVMIGIYALSLIVAGLKHGETTKPLKWNIGGSFIRVLISLIILSCGGFFK